MAHIHEDVVGELAAHLDLRDPLADVTRHLRSSGDRAGLPVGRDDRQSGFLPGLGAAGHVGGVVAGGDQRFGDPGGAAADLADHDDLAVGRQLALTIGELIHRDPRRAFDVPRFPFVGVAYVEEQRARVDPALALDRIDVVHVGRCHAVGSFSRPIWCCAFHASYPPSRSDTSSKPAAASTLAPIDERYPLAQYTTVGRVGSSSLIRAVSCGSGSVAAPGITPGSVSPGLRTSTTWSASTSPFRSSSSATLRRELGSTTSGC